MELLDGFPAVVVPAKESAGSLAELIENIKQRKDWLEKELKRSGAILFKGWQLNNGIDFSKAVEAFEYKPHGYFAGLAPRRQITEIVYTANELPLDLEIPFHNEMAYLERQPDVLIFFCETPSPEGGETAIVKGKVVYERMMEEEFAVFLDELEKKGVMYTVISAKSSQELYNTDDKDHAQKIAKENGSRLEWMEDGSLKIIHGPRIGVINTEDEGKVWFNSIALVAQRIELMSMGDGSAMPVEAVRCACRIMSEEMSKLKWEKGDFVVIDNRSVLHSRLPGKPPRSILVSLCDKPQTIKQLL